MNKKNKTIPKSNFLSTLYNNERGITNIIAFIRGTYYRVFPHAHKMNWQKWETITDRDLMHEKRISFFVDCIDKNDRSVIDLGCGKRLIEKKLPDGCTYIPVDYCSRGAETIICDFNKLQYPEIISDVVLMISVLQWIENPIWLIKEACLHCKKKVLCHYITPSDENNISIMIKREGEGIKNHLSPIDIIAAFNSNGFILSNESKILYANNRYELFFIFLHS